MIEGIVYSQGTRAHQAAMPIIFDSPIQFFAGNPSQGFLEPDYMELIGHLPTTWDETMYIDGYPGKYAVIARRHQNQWYIAGVNAEKAAKELTVKLPMLAGKKVRLYGDNENKEAYMQEVEIKQNGELKISVQPGGGFALQQN